MSNSTNIFDNSLDEIDFNSGSQNDETTFAAVSSLHTSTHGILEYKSKKYAVGLVWLSRGGLDDEAPDNQKARSLQADFTCNRHFADQCGYGFLKKGHRIAMASMASLAADALVGEWHGVFEADNGWLYIAVHSDNIAPDGDLFFYSEQEAYNHFMSQAEAFKWPKTYAPASWNIKINDGEISLDKFIENGSFTTLSPVNLDAFFYGKTNKFLFFGLVIVSLIIFISHYGLKSSLTNEFIQTPPPLEDEIGLIQTPPREARDILTNLSETVSQNRILKPNVVIEKCLNNIETLMISIPGWPVASALCTEKSATINWRKGTGDFSFLYQYTKDLPKHHIPTLNDNSTFSLSLFSEYDEDDYVETILGSKEETFIEINKKFGRLGLINITETDSVDSLNNVMNTNSQDFSLPGVELTSHHNLSLSTKMSPEDLKEKFNFPAVTFNKIEWNIQSGQWFYDTIIYSKTKNIRN